MNLIGITHVAPAVALLAQTDPEINVGGSLVGSAIDAFLTTLLVGAIMVAVAPAFTERMMADVLAEPFGTFLYGIACLLALGLVSFLLAITVIGLLLAAPLLLVAYLVWAVGSAIGYLAIAKRLIGRGDGWLKPLLVGAGISGLLALTGIGGLLGLCIGAAGFGAVLRNTFG